MLLFSAGAGPPPPAPSQAPGPALAIDGDVVHALRVTADDLRRLPAMEQRVSFEGEHGQTTATYTGVRLWTLLEQAEVVGASKPRDRVGRVLIATGRDGYTAALALAEIDPAFEHKPVLIAYAANGQPMADGALRLLVPGDRRGGRSVRDLVRIAVR
jgi:DMSO/TMAO reductase YedYZ molybdopterin-dependent catalytic subunit